MKRYFSLQVYTHLWGLTGMTMEEHVHVKQEVMVFSMLAIVMLGCTTSLARQISCVPPPPRTFITTKTSYCYQDFCTCTTNTANCSRNFGRLTFLPVLPKTVENVIFSFNNLTTIQHDDFFGNVSMIRCLDLQYNWLESISKGAFRNFTSLRTLYLDHNRLTYGALTPVFVTNGLFNLHIGHMSLGPIPSGYFARTPLPSLARLDVSGSYLWHLNLSEMEPLTGLTELTALECRISHVTTAPLPQLVYLNLGFNDLYDLPDSCGSNGSSLLPGLKELRFERNKVDDFHNQICFPNLTKLELNRNSIVTVKQDMFSGTQFPSLLQLSLDHMQIKKIEAFAFRNPTLQSLSLMYSNIQFSVTAHPDSFSGIPNLSFLQMSHNYGSDSSEHTFYQLFGSLSRLKKLYLGSCGIYSVSRAMFANTTGLTHLYLYSNRLAAIPDGLVDSMNNLTDLILSKNQIQVVSEETFSPATRSRLRQLDLSGNPFVCDCDLRWFQGWFMSSPSVFSNAFGNYSCSNIPDTPLKNFRQVEQACLLSRGASTAFIGSVVSVLIILTIVSVIYQHRWHIRLILAFRGHGEIMRRRLQEENFTYDVFVSSAEEDEAWVLEELLPTLEGRLALRVCFHKRDFVPGKNILNNIVDSVKGSKKFLMVFSKDFAASRWCQFELDLCLGHVFDNDDDLIVTCLDDVASRDVTSTMTAVLRTTTYIQWPQDPGAAASFWNLLERALHQILQ